jgi:uncharacterized membrane protein
MQISQPSFLFGIATGMRSMTGTAALCLAGSLGLARPGYAPTSDRLLKAALIAAVGEIAGDKMPFAPDRRIPASFALRLVLGAVGGAALGEGVTEGAFAGALGAMVGTLAGRFFRGPTTKNRYDLIRALTEDAAAAAIAYSAIRTQRAVAT